MNCAEDINGFPINSVVFDKLNICYNAEKTQIVLWNKYQMFVYENFNFKDSPLEYQPEFIICKVVPSKHSLICLDCNGNVHTIAMRNNNRQKRLKNNFLPRDYGITNLINYNQDVFLSLKHDVDKIYLSFHKIGTDFNIIGRYCLKSEFMKFDRHELLERSIVKHIQINENEVDKFKNMFTVNNLPNCDNHLIIISFDAMTVFGCLFNPKLDEDIELKKVYSCPSKICDIIIDIPSIDIVLTSGSIIQVNLLENSHRVVHLNSSISSICKLQNELIYTDGINMWKTGNYRSEKCIKFNQYRQKNCKHFVLVDDKILLVTFSDLIYVFDANNKNNFITNLTIEGYHYPAESLINYSEFFYKIFEETDKTQLIAKDIQTESNFLAAMALAQRQDIINNVLKCNINLYDNYEQALKLNDSLTLTSKIEEYFEPDCILVNLRTELQRQSEVYTILKYLTNYFKLHINIFNCDKIITVSIPVKSLKDIANYIVPVKKGFLLHNLRVKIIFLACLPGPLDIKQNIWTVILRKEFILYSEKFISSVDKNNSINYVKYTTKDVNNLVQNLVDHLYGSKYNFTVNHLVEFNKQYFNLYIKVTNDYIEKIKLTTSKSNLNKQQIELIVQKITLSDFINARGVANFHIGQIPITLSINNDDITNKILVIECENLNVALDMRRFFSNLLYDDTNLNASYSVPQAHYAYVENLQRSLREELIRDVIDEEKLMKFTELYHKNVIGALPL